MAARLIASIAASVTQKRWARGEPKRNSILAPPDAKPRHSGPRSSQPTTVPASSVWAAHMLPTGPSRNNPLSAAVRMIGAGKDRTERRYCQVFDPGCGIRRPCHLSTGGVSDRLGDEDRCKTGSDGSKPTRDATRSMHAGKSRPSRCATSENTSPLASPKGSNQPRSPWVTMIISAARRNLTARRVLSFSSTAKPLWQRTAAQPTSSLSFSMSGLFIFFPIDFDRPRLILLVRDFAGSFRPARRARTARARLAIDESCNPTTTSRGEASLAAARSQAAAGTARPAQ